MVAVNQLPKLLQLRNTPTPPGKTCLISISKGTESRASEDGQGWTSPQMFTEVLHPVLFCEPSRRCAFCVIISTGQQRQQYFELFLSEVTNEVDRINYAQILMFVLLKCTHVNIMAPLVCLFQLYFDLSSRSSGLQHVASRVDVAIPNLNSSLVWSDYWSLSK